jgi:hypothetical protein
MPTESEELFEAAKALNHLRPPLVSDEVCARTMANRMYYAAYLATREAIRLQLGDRSFDVTHGALVDSLTAASDPEVKDVGTALKRLRSMRVDSDYRLDETITKFVAAVYLADARFVLDNARRLAARFPRIRRR